MTTTTTTNLGLNKPAAGDGTWDVPINANADTLDALFAASGGTHDHSGVAGHGQKLSQANTHQGADTDSAPTALHHTLGTGANQAAAGNDSRLSDARTPTAHHATHSTGGTDAIAPADIGAAATVHTHTSADVSDFAEAARDTLGAALVAGANVTITVNDGADTITIASTGGGGGGTSLTVDEVDGLPSVVTTHLTFPNGSVTNNGGGQATVAFPATATPTAHASTHASGGSDPVSPADIGAAAAAHTHAASDIASGTIATARLGSGTASGSTYLRGDGTWATPASGATDPTTTATLTEEFLGGANAAGQLGTQGWTLSGGTASFQVVAGHPGVVRASTGTTNFTASSLILHGAAGAFADFGDTFDLTVIFRLNTNDSSTHLSLGVSGQNTSTTPSASVHIEKLTGDTSFYGCVRVASSPTRTAALLASDTSWHRARIRKIASNQVGFTLDGGTEVTLTATLPTGALCLWLQIENQAAADKSVDWDYVGLTVSGLSR